MMDLKSTAYWQIFGDVFEFMKKGLPVGMSDEYWDQTIDEAGEIFKKYEGTPQQEFAREQLVSVLYEFERIFKENRKSVSEIEQEVR